MSMTATNEIRFVAYPERHDFMAMWAATVALWLHNAETRRHLHGLEPHRLSDIGLSKEDRLQECAKWFWQK